MSTLDKLDGEISKSFSLFARNSGFAAVGGYLTGRILRIPRVGLGIVLLSPVYGFITAQECWEANNVMKNAERMMMLNDLQTISYLQRERVSN